MTRKLDENVRDLLRSDSGRSEDFAREEGVEASLRDQVPSDLIAKLERDDIKAAHYAVDLWQREEANRAEWLEKRLTLAREIDEFIDPIYDSPLEWSATNHYPVALTVCKSYHARFYSATFGAATPFTMRGTKSHSQQNAEFAQQYMEHATKRWANYNQGIESVVDDGIWEWASLGSTVWKSRWDRKFLRFMDVEEEIQPTLTLETDPQTGEDVPMRGTKKIEREVMKIEKIFDGPCVEKANCEDIALIGDSDPDLAEAVIERLWMNSSEILSLVDQKVFRKEAAYKVIESGRDYVGSQQSDSLKIRRAREEGRSSVDPSHERDKYEILEAYLRIPIDDTGIDTDVVVWVHKDTKEILRATYLKRIQQSGRRPYAKADFHLRGDNKWGVGLIELTYTLAKEIDAIRNMRMDFGLLSSLPFGYYRPSSSMNNEAMPIEPGTLIPLDQPTQDVMFPQLGNRTVFGFQEEQSLDQMLQKVTAMSELSYGLLSGQGAARTATGARAVIGEANANLDIYLRRLNRGLGKVYKLMWEAVQRRAPEGEEFRVIGADGLEFFQILKSRSQLEGEYEFVLDPNSANSNKQIQIEAANQAYQMTSNPLDFQLGIITPLNRYEAIKNLMQTLGIKDFSRFISKPREMNRIYTPMEIMDRILIGLDVPLGPDQDLDGFMALVEQFFASDELMGQLMPEQVIALRAALVQAQQLQQALAAQQAQVQNAMQQQLNAANSTAASGSGSAALPQGVGNGSNQGQ